MSSFPYCLYFAVCLFFSGGIESDKFFPSQLGAAVLASALSPDEGLIVFKELQKARRSFVLENELHTIYLVRVILSYLINRIVYENPQIENPQIENPWKYT